MLGFMFGGLVKKMERAANNVSQSSIKLASQELHNLFDEKLYPLADKLDYIAQKRIDTLIEVEGKFKDDIDTLLNNADDKVKQALEKIDEVRQEAIRDLNETSRQTNIYLENRIDQLSLVIMQALSTAQETGQLIVQATLVKINLLEDKLFEDANYLIDKIDEVLDSKLEQIRNELKRYLAHALPSPLDKCRQKLKLGWKPGAMLSDIELYELTKCYELSKLNETTPIDEVVKIYAQLQLNAARMAALVKNAPELKRRAIQDWLKYGVLCEFWCDTAKSYDSSVLFESKPQRLPF